MDPIRIPTSHDPLPRGESYFIPFEGFNARVVNGKGQADFKLALDLPPMKTIQLARTYLTNNRALASRIIEYREFSVKEIQRSPDLVAYMGLHKGSL